MSDWQGITDNDLRPHMATAATSARQSAIKFGAATATAGYYDNDDQWVGGVTVAKVHGGWIAVDINANDGEVIIAEYVGDE